MCHTCFDAANTPGKGVNAKEVKVHVSLYQHVSLLKSLSD